MKEGEAGISLLDGDRILPFDGEVKHDVREIVNDVIPIGGVHDMIVVRRELRHGGHPGMILYVPRRAARSRIVPSMHENRMESHINTFSVMMVLNPSMYTSLPEAFAAGSSFCLRIASCSFVARLRMIASHWRSDSRK